jgi:hypothetical protein
MTVGDLTFYWGESTIFHKRNGRWEGVRLHLFDEGGSPLFSPEDLLDTLDEDGYRLVFSRVHGRGLVRCDPLEMFQSDDWITYEPELGYFITPRGKVLLLTSCAPRNRYKGLHQRRLSCVLPVDSGQIPSTIASKVETSTNTGIPFDSVVLEVANRLNNPFSESWYSSTLAAIENPEHTPVVLMSNVVFIPNEKALSGHLLYRGTLLGQVRQVKNRRLIFTPRNKPSSRIEKTVVSWVRSKLVTSLK